MTRPTVPQILSANLACAVIGGCSAFAHSRKVVPRLTLAEFLSSPPVYTAPVIIRDIAPPAAIKALADELMTTLGPEEVQMQRKLRADDGRETTEQYDVPLGETIDHLMDSRHGDARLAFCEGLLPGPAPGSAALGEKLRRLREAPRGGGEA